jgi:hypothetical protein
MSHKTQNKTTLAAIYGVSLPTFIKLIKDIEGLELKPKIRILTPKQVAIIYEELGEP